YPIYAFGSEEQKHHWLPKMASGEVIGCFGLTEPDYGSNPSGMITVAKEAKGGWVLNGAKMWITNGSTAQIAIVWAKTGRLEDVDSIRGFIVPTNTPGFSSKDQKGKLSLRASDTSELVLQDVCVPKDALLPKSAGLKSPLMCLTQARYGIAWGSVGAAMACYDEAVSYAKTRVMFGKPIGGFQLQQARLAEMLTEITKAQLLCLQLGRLKDQGKATPQQVSLAKRNNVSIATDVAGCCLRWRRRPPARNSPTPFAPTPSHRSSSPASGSPPCASWRADSPGGPPRSTPRIWTHAACAHSPTPWSSYPA